MSRIGKNPVEIPSGVEVALIGDMLRAKGKMGELTAPVAPEVEIVVADGKVTVKPRNDSKRARALWGTTRALVSNVVVGVSEGFTRNLEMTGVGYRAAVKGDVLNLQLGYSHEIDEPIPEGLKVACETQTQIAITGADKHKVGQFAAEIRGKRGPEPYKGKGVRYAGEAINRKEGKKK